MRKAIGYSRRFYENQRLQNEELKARKAERERA